MHGSNGRVNSGAGRSTPILRRLMGWVAGDAPAARGWDTPTLAPNDDALTDKPCVLVVDDDPFNRTLACETFSICGITPVLAVDGAQAVALASELRLDLILMDLQMPVLDGLAATRQIRRGEIALERARVPVLAYTSAAPEHGLLSAFGFDGVLNKPCEARDLRACLLRWCPSKGSAWELVA